MATQIIDGLDWPVSISAIPAGTVWAVLAAWRAAGPVYREGRTGELLAWAEGALASGREEDAVRVLLADLEGPPADEVRAALARARGRVHRGCRPGWPA